MMIGNILSYICCFVWLTPVPSIGHLYESVTCLTAIKVMSVINSETAVTCAIFCDIENMQMFSFDIKTRECSVFTADNNVLTTCIEGSGHSQYFKLNECPLPVPQGYNLVYPYSGSKSMAKYSCMDFKDQPVVDSCPVVKCNGPGALPTTLSSCSVKDVFNSSLSKYEGGVTCTIKGVPCQRWDTNDPHYVYIHVLRGRSDLDNRCQLESEVQPWCYTTDPNTRWDFCPVEEEARCEAPSPMLTTSSNTTVETSIVWPFSGSINFAWYRCKSLTADEPVSSCPVTRCNSEHQWSGATVSCSVKDCYNVTSQTYNGRVCCTVGGITCQRWDSNYPHKPGASFQGRSDLENWCQMAGKTKPWCFTTDPTVEYGFCAVDPCS